MKRFHFLVTLLFFHTLFSQPFNGYQKIWATYFGGQATRFTNSVVDSEGNLIAFADVIGGFNTVLHDESYYNQFVIPTNPNLMYDVNLVNPGGAYSYQTLVAKFSPSGQLLQSGYLPFYSYRIKIDSNNNLYFFGETLSDNLATPGSWLSAPFDTTIKLVMAKVNPDFSINWLTYIPPSTGGITQFCIDDNLNVYYVSSTSVTSGITTPGTFQPGFITEYDTSGQVYNNGYIFKLNTNGQLQWATYCGITTAFAIDYSNGENAVVVVQNRLDENPSLTQYDNYYITADAYQQNPTKNIVSKLDIDNGQRIYGSYFGDVILTHIVCDRSGGYYFLGLSDNPSVSSLITSSAYQTTFGGTADVYLGKTTYDLNPVWGTYIGGSEWDEPNFESGLVLKNDALYFAGLTLSTNNFINGSNTYQTVNNGNGDIFMMKFSKTGNLIWGSFFGGSAQEGLGGSIAPVNDEVFYLVGDTYSSSAIVTPGCYQPALNFHPSYPSSNFGNGFIARFAPQEELANQNFQTNSFTLYPNPANQYITLQTNNLQPNSQLTIYNNIGQKVLNTQLTTATEQNIDITTLASGIYYVEIKTESETIKKQKLIIK